MELRNKLRTFGKPLLLILSILLFCAFGSVLFTLLNGDGAEVTTYVAEPYKENFITVYHDDEKNVTCWIYSSPHTYSASISCIPDDQLT